jgi:hypothetical protein
VSDLEKLAAWMMANSFATGHGDTIDDLLIELGGQVADLRENISSLEGDVAREQNTVDRLSLTLKNERAVS